MTVMINYEFKLKICIIEIERKTNSLDRNSNNIHQEKPAGGISALTRTFSISSASLHVEVDMSCQDVKQSDLHSYRIKDIANELSKSSCHCHIRIQIINYYS